MATTLFQAISAVPGRIYSAFGDFTDLVTGRKAEREAERNQKDLVDFFSEKLVSAFRAGRIRMLPYYDNLTAETPEHRLAYRWLLKEPVIKSAFMGKLLAVMSLDLQVDAASETPRDKEIASFVEESLRRCAGGPAEIVWSILFGALLEGNGIAEKVWGRIDRGKYRGRPTIRAVKAKDSHDYQIEIDEFNNPVLVRSRRTAEEFPMSNFTFFSHMAAFSNPIGMSDLRAVYRAGWMLDTVWKLRAIGLERFTLPIFMSKYPQGRNDIRDSINDAVKKAKSLGYLTVPQEAAVEAIEMASKSGSDFDAAIKGLQEECFIAIQGATLQALAGNVTEGRGDSTVHKTTSELFVWYLSCAAATVINDQYIPDIVDLNYADSDYPTCWLGGVNDGDLKAALELDTGLLQLGLVQDPHDLARRYRRQLSNDPKEALATLKLIRQLGAPEQPPPGQGGGMPGLGGLGGGGGSGPPMLPGGDVMKQVMSHMQDGGGNGGASPFDEKYGQAMPGAEAQADPAELRSMVDECLAKLGDDDEEEPEKFTDEEPPDGPAPITDQTAATPDSQAVETLLAEAQQQGSQFLANLATKALTRYVRGGGPRLFLPDEMKALQSECARAVAAADLLGRSRVRLRSEQLGVVKLDEVNIFTGKVRRFADEPTNFSKVPSVPLQPPLSSLEYFQSLVPMLNVEPLTWLPEIERQAFTMAVATEQQLLEKVQKEIASRIASGEYGWGPQAIQDLIESAGVSPTNPQYAEMVFRTNVKDALAKGTHEELSDPEVLPNFPVWKYSAIVGDGRGRPTHSARNGNYYPSEVPFTKVRGEGPEDVCNCRCVLPGNYVSGNLLLASQSRYAGDAIEIKTRLGARITVTLNHPILTDKGFVAAGLLNQGDNLVSYVGKDERLVSSDNVKNAPALAEDIFRTLSSLDALWISKRWASLDFHGDGESVNRNVEIVGSTRLLRNYIDANRTKHRSQRMLSRSNVEEFSLAGGCSANVCQWDAGSLAGSPEFDSHSSKTDSYSFPVHEVLATKCVDGFSSDVSFGDAAHVQPSYRLSFDSVSDFNSPGYESASQGFVFDSSFPAQITEGFSCFVACNQLIENLDVFGMRSCGTLASGSDSSYFGEFLSQGHRPDADLGAQFDDADSSVVPFNNAGGDVDGMPKCHSFGLASSLNVPLAEPVLNTITTNAVLPGQLMNRFSGDVLLDDVVEIRRFHYAGPVYDFQSVNGYYTIGERDKASILVGNCDFIPIDRWEWDDLQRNGARVTAI